MPRKNRIGAHFSRLLFLIGTSTFVADTQSGFRLLSAPLLAELIDRVTWKGYESESEVLWRTLALRSHDSRRSRSRPSTSKATAGPSSKRGVTRRRIAARVHAAAPLDGQHGDAGLRRVRRRSPWPGWLSPAWANVASRLRRGRCPGHAAPRLHGPRTGGWRGREGSGGACSTFAGHLAVTTVLVGAFVRTRGASDSRPRRRRSWWATSGTFAGGRSRRCFGRVRFRKDGGNSDLGFGLWSLGFGLGLGGSSGVESAAAAAAAAAARAAAVARRGRSGCRSCRSRPRLRSRRAPRPCRSAARSAGSTSAGRTSPTASTDSGSGSAASPS